MPTTIPSTAAAAPVPLACVAAAIPAAERPAHRALLTRLFREAVRERHEIPGAREGAGGSAEGYAFRFEADAFEDVARFVATERRCCPFLTFTLELSPAGGPLWLHLAGPAGARAVLDAELPAPMG